MRKHGIYTINKPQVASVRWHQSPFGKRARRALFSTKISQAPEHCSSFSQTVNHNTTTINSSSRLQTQSVSSTEQSYENAHGDRGVDGLTDRLDEYVEQLAVGFDLQSASSVTQLFQQYRERAGRIIDRIIPYEEHPEPNRRADKGFNTTFNGPDGVGDGVVLVAHALQNSESRQLEKICICSGFVVNASSRSSTHDADVIISCAHTLEEMYRHLKRNPQSDNKRTLSFIVTATGGVRPITQALSSMPRSDLVAFEALPLSPSESRLRSLPLTPFPVYTGTPVLTHLFGSPEPPDIRRSKARIANKHNLEHSEVEVPVQWLEGRAWRRWARGIMLGYRSYTGQEIEAGVSSVLPHIMTSVLPTSGSSGGPLVNAQTGSVVGMISGRRMDNRVEGERGWGASAEGIFEMFALPGFMPASQKTK